MRVAIAWLACLAVATGADAQDDSAAANRAVALHRVIFNGEPDGPRTREEFDALTELALAYRSGTGVAPDSDLACSLVELASGFARRVMPETPTAARASEVRELACADVRDITVAWGMLGCPTFGLTPHTFVIGATSVATIDRYGIHLDTERGTQVHPLGLSCGEIVVGLRHRRVAPPGGVAVPARNFIELTTWLPKFAYNEPAPRRTLTWRLIALDASGAEPPRETLDLLTEPEWAWPTPEVPPRFADGASLQMRATGEVRFWFERAPELGTGLIEAPRR